MVGKMPRVSQTFSRWLRGQVNSRRFRLSITWIVGAALLGGAGLWLLTLLPIADPLPQQLQGWRTVGSYFDRPPAYPGKPWTKDGRSVDSAELDAGAGPSHCGWDSVTMLNVGWPLGTRSSSADQDRQYVRDPSRTLRTSSLMGTWTRNPTLPADASDTGYRYGALKLYLAASDENSYAYLLAPADSERWPRSDPLTLCS
jgi:hypothetical protein